MKYIKTYVLAACLPILIAACDSNDDNPVNTVSTTVEFEKPEITIKETVDFLSMPIHITSDAERDGDVFIKVTMKENNANFELDKDIIITTETYRIAPGVETINFEIGFHIYTEEIDKGRNVTFHISSVEGASTGAKSSCKIDIIEKNFIEGTYMIRGISAFDGLTSSGKCYIIAEDETLDRVSLDFGLGASARIEFTQKIANREWDIEILPFEYIGVFDGQDVYLSWALLNEESKEISYDRNKPIKGKFERKQVDGKETLIFTLTDGLGLIGSDSSGQLRWFQNVWRENATIEKQD